jgi:hydrogenase maturation factor
MTNFDQRTKKTCDLALAELRRAIKNIEALRDKTEGGLTPAFALKVATETTAVALDFLHIIEIDRKKVLVSRNES